MSPITYSCNLCGFTIRPGRPRKAPVSWLSEFRGVVSSLTGKVSLTGVGLFVDTNTGSFIAPPDANSHWNDSAYARERGQEFGVGTQFENGRYGFVFHESCWCLLRRAFHPQPVPTDRLYELCLSMPKPLATSCINWTHKYGGLYYWVTKPYFPWDFVEDPGVYGMDDLEDSESSDSEAGREWVERYGLPPPREEDSDEDQGDDDEWVEPTLRESTVTSDPYHVGEIDMILQETSKSPPSRSLPYLLSNTTLDRFSQLPQELRTAIASHLPTKDFLAGRLALCGLLDIFDSQQFWATRFIGHGAERSWLFESYQKPGYTQDWRYLYRQTSDTHLSHSGGIRNRIRIWELALRIKIILSLEPLTRLPPFNEGTESVNYKWTAAQADISNPPPDQPHESFVRGCRVLHRQRARLQSEWPHTNIALSFTQVGEDFYLSGLRLDFGNGDDVQIGYRALDEQTFDLGSKTLMGIRLAIGPRGIQGLQFITGARGHCSIWYGRQENLPETNSLVSWVPIVALEAGLDACKIVSLAVAQDIGLSEDHDAQSANMRDLDSLRESALWFPGPPPAYLDLNKQSFTYRLHHAGGFRPLIWTHFGGPNGIYLRNLIALRFHSSQELYGIEFKYNEPCVPGSCHSLGRHLCAGRPCYADRTFDIDGPGGELVASIDISQLTFPWDETDAGGLSDVVDIKIETNRGRSFRLMSEEDFDTLATQTEGKIITRRLEVTEGTTITGLYAHQFHGVRSQFMTLGVISESL